MGTSLSKMNRRTFVAGAAAGMAALPGLAAADEAPAPAPSVTGEATPGYVCTFDWLGEKPQIADADIAETIDTEILIVGAGHAGIQCACAAAEGGAKVDVIEKVAEDARKVKGEDIGHCNSQWLIDQGFGPYDVG